jgi:hypothetical protein
MATNRPTARKRKPKTKAQKRPAGTPDNSGVPIEHYRGEKSQRGVTGERGDIDQETLDPTAPYNKTYGR